MSLRNSSLTPPTLPGHATRNLTPARARNCLLANQFATPGLGSLLGRRWIAGGGQLALALTGFVLFLIWFGLTIRDYYGLLSDQTSAPVSHGRWAVAGILFMAAAWCWSWVTSLSLLREAKKNQRRTVQNNL